jgi:hypothetical protein
MPQKSMPFTLFVSAESLEKTEHIKKNTLLPAKKLFDFRMSKTALTFSNTTC